MIQCDICSSEIPDAAGTCPTCGFYAGPPNVRAAEREAEIEALEGRYQRARERAKTTGCLPTVEKFDEAVKQSSSTVINVDLRFLHFFVTNEKGLYTNYERGVAAHTRKPAALYHDAARRGVGGTLFGTYSSEIIYAALSLDGHGPQSYGSYAIRLRDIAISSRATVMENNSYDFVRKHNLQPGDKPPLGYIASWERRNKLAVAKLADYITAKTVAEDFPRLLLSSAGDRATDEFIEVLICGTFDLNAIESVSGSSKTGSRDDRDLLRMTKQHLSRAGRPWIEND